MGVVQPSIQGFLVLGRQGLPYQRIRIMVSLSAGAPICGLVHDSPGILGKEDFHGGCVDYTHATALDCASLPPSIK